MATHTHPLVSLNEAEVNKARDIVRKTHAGAVLHFRVIYLQEPPKAELTRFLDLEHSGRLADIKPGQYVLNVEAARETGGRELVSVPITAAGGRATGKSELGAVAVTR